MKTLVILCLVLSLLISCKLSKQLSNDDNKLLNFGYFTIMVPQTWKRVNVKGIDSFVGEISIKADTVLTFDLGWYSSNLSEGCEDYIVQNDSLFIVDSVKKNGVIKLSKRHKGRADSSSIATVTVNQKQYVTIDGYKAKLVTPTHAGKGTTGVYIDSLWGTVSDKDKFQINGQNLTSKQQKQLVEAMKTLKFYEHPNNVRTIKDE